MLVRIAYRGPEEVAHPNSRPAAEYPNCAHVEGHAVPVLFAPHSLTYGKTRLAPGSLIHLQKRVKLNCSQRRSRQAVLIFPLPRQVCGLDSRHRQNSWFTYGAVYRQPVGSPASLAEIKMRLRYLP